jgi:hypothetical protein
MIKELTKSEFEQIKNNYGLSGEGREIKILNIPCHLKLVDSTKRYYLDKVKSAKFRLKCSYFGNSNIIENSGCLAVSKLEKLEKYLDRYLQPLFDSFRFKIHSKLNNFYNDCKSNLEDITKNKNVLDNIINKSKELFSDNDNIVCNWGMDNDDDNKYKHISEEEEKINNSKSLEDFLKIGNLNNKKEFYIYDKKENQNRYYKKSLMDFGVDNYGVKINFELDNVKIDKKKLSAVYKILEGLKELKEL